MFGFAFSIFLYVGSNVAYTADTQATLTQQWDQTHQGEATLAPSDESAPVLFFDHPRLAYGEPLAKISVPSIKFNGIVLEGTDDKVLAGGPGHLPETAYPGEPDNVAISNHNSYSLSWGDIKKGDVIQLQTNWGTFNYRVNGTRVVDARDTSVTASTYPKPTLTFITCWPLWAGALARQRFVVFADLVR
jgi:LPXTG-site transpeptidase (sortase) family protein